MMSRVNPLDNLDLDEFKTKPTEPKPKQERQAIAKMAEDNGFPSRQAPAKVSNERPKQHYFRTGRNQQINIKGSQECDEHLKRLVAEIDAPKGVILEEALKALEAIKPQVIERLDREYPNRHSK
jgi:hypothetical protein